MKEALFAKRTVASFGNYLVGTEDLLAEIFKAAINIGFLGKSHKWEKFFIKNSSEMPVYLASPTIRITVAANSETMVTVKEGEKIFSVKNFYTGNNKNLQITQSH